MPQRSIALTGTINPDRTLTVRLPDDVSPGPCRVVVVVGEPTAPATEANRLPFNLTPIDTGPWPEGFTASREQLYDDDGR